MRYLTLLTLLAACGDVGTTPLPEELNPIASKVFAAGAAKTTINGNLVITSANTHLHDLIVLGNVVFEKNSNGSSLTDCEVKGNLQIDSNNVTVTSCVVSGNLQATKNNVTVTSSSVWGNVQIDGNNATVTESAVFGNMQVQGNNSYIVKVGVVGAFQIQGNNASCSNNYAFKDLNSNHLVEPSERGAALSCCATCNTCQFASSDPLAPLMPQNHLQEGFEKLPAGKAPELYYWLTSPGTQISVTEEAAFEGKRSLKVVGPGNVTAGYDPVGVKFCVRCEAMEHFKASFAVRFESFVRWNGIAVTNSPRLAYWWWARADGSVFDDVTFAQLHAGQWHQVAIEIDRPNDLATITIDGVAHTAALSLTWYADAAQQPMGCIRLINIAEEAQTFYVDSIDVHALD